METISNNDDGSLEGESQRHRSQVEIGHDDKSSSRIGETIENKDLTKQEDDILLAKLSQKSLIEQKNATDLSGAMHSKTPELWQHNS